MVMDRRPLARQPDQREELEIAARRDMDRVPGIVIWLAAEVLGGKKVVGPTRKTLHQRRDGSDPIRRVLCPGYDRFAPRDEIRQSRMHYHSTP